MTSAEKLSRRIRSKDRRIPMAAPSSGHRRKILLFLAAVLVPCLALIIFGLQVVRQERELAGKRAAEERLRRGQEIGQHLLVRLERIKLEETQQAAARPEQLAGYAYGDPETILIGLVADGRLLLPWEFSPAVEESQKALDQVGFRGKIQAGEQAEFELRDPARAAALFRAAASVSPGGVQKAYARLLLARALAKSGRKADAVALYRQILRLPASLTDDLGVPLYLYAAERLQSVGADAAEVAGRLFSAIEEKRWSSPLETAMIGSLLVRMTAADTPSRHVDERAGAALDELRLYRQKLEAVLGWQRDFENKAHLFGQGGRDDAGGPVWISDNDGSRLMSLGDPLAGSGRLLLVIDGQALLSSMRRERGFSTAFPEDIRLTAAAGAPGELLGPNFPGLKIVWPAAGTGPPANVWSSRRSFYLLAMTLVVALTLFGAYLLWRDVRRELKLAELRSQFVSSVSHELKTPLTAIRMFAETLRLRRSSDPATREEYLDTIVKESERLSRLLNNVLDFSKIEQGKMVYKPAPASLVQVIMETARALEYPLKQQGFALKIEHEECVPDVVVDRDGLEQAVMNLLTNAMKYSGDSREIGLNLTKKGAWAVIQVIDHGVGVDASEQERIFDKFYRVASPENDRLPGTGLGLSLVSHFVKAHHGRVEVESSPGRGSTFSLYIPLEQES
jgi:signal transduction histidine kinase/tetratricopeptide (TPR) repeat protein